MQRNRHMMPRPLNVIWGVELRDLLNHFCQYSTARCTYKQNTDVGKTTYPDPMKDLWSWAFMRYACIAHCTATYGRPAAAEKFKVRTFFGSPSLASLRACLIGRVPWHEQPLFSPRSGMLNHKLALCLLSCVHCVIKISRNTILHCISNLLSCENTQLRVTSPFNLHFQVMHRHTQGLFECVSGAWRFVFLVISNDT